jgi:regulator of nonsense transcripts 2
LFQRYYWYKKKNAIWTLELPFPKEVEYVVCDTIELLRPKLRMCTSWEEASQAAEALDKEFAAKLGQFLISFFPTNSVCKC